MSEGHRLGGVGGLDQTPAWFSLGSPYPMLEPQSPHGSLLPQSLPLTPSLTGLALPEPLGRRLRVPGLGFQDRLQSWGGKGFSPSHGTPLCGTQRHLPVPLFPAP